MRADRRLLVGKIVGLYGIQGWVKLESYTEPRTQIFAYQPWLLTSTGGEVEIADAHGHAQGKGLVGSLPGFDNRDIAVKLVGAEIRVWRSALPKPKRGELYWADLEGLVVVTLQGVKLGQVSHLFATGANDVLVVRNGDRERMIPFVREQFVHDVDMDGGRITVDWDPDF